MRSSKYEIVWKVMYTWMEKFLESSFYEKLGDYEKFFASFVIAPFIDGMVDEARLLPEEWNEENISYFFLVTMPNGSGAALDFPIHQTRVMEAFFLYLDDRSVIKNGARLAKKIRSLESGIIEAMTNSKFGQMARKKFPVAKINIEDFKDANGNVNRPRMISF